MNRNLLIGLVVIAVGVIAFNYDHLTHTRREKQIGIGPFSAVVEEEEPHRPFTVPPVLGGIIIGAGIVLVVLAMKKR